MNAKEIYAAIDKFLHGSHPKVFTYDFFVVLMLTIINGRRQCFLFATTYRNSRVLLSAFQNKSFSSVIFASVKKCFSIKQLVCHKELHICVPYGDFRNRHVEMCILGILVRKSVLGKNPKTKIPRLRSAFWGFWPYTGLNMLNRKYQVAHSFLCIILCDKSINNISKP